MSVYLHSEDYPVLHYTVLQIIHLVCKMTKCIILQLNRLQNLCYWLSLICFNCHILLISIYLSFLFIINLILSARDSWVGRGRGLWEIIKRKYPRGNTVVSYKYVFVCIKQIVSVSFSKISFLKIFFTIKTDSIAPLKQIPHVFAHTWRIKLILI